MFGCRALYHDGWKAVTLPPDPGGRARPRRRPWELYDLRADPSECHDLAAAEPERLAGDGRAVVGRGRALPGAAARQPAVLGVRLRAARLSVPPRRRYDVLPGRARCPRSSPPTCANRPHSHHRRRRPPGDGPSRACLARARCWAGGRFLRPRSMPALHPQHRRPRGAPCDVRTRVPAGRHELSFRFERTGEHRGSVRSSSTGSQSVRRRSLASPRPGSRSRAPALTCGYCGGLPTGEGDLPAFRFTGVIFKVIVSLEGDSYIDPIGDVRAAMISQ